MNLKQYFEMIEFKHGQLLIVEEQSSGWAKNLRDCWNEARSRVLAGETTGDLVNDAMLVAAYGRPSQKFADAYRLIQEKLIGKKGQMVIIVRRDEKFSGCSGFGREPRNEEYFLEEHLWAGVLTDEKLILDPVKSVCDLPVVKYVLCWDLKSREFKLCNGGIHLGIDFPFHLDQPLERKNPPVPILHGSDFRLEVKIGEDEIKGWVSSFENPSESLYEDLAQSLGQLVLRP